MNVVSFAIKILVLALTLFCFACGPENNPASQPGNETPAPTVEVKKKTFDDDVATVRYSEYTWMFVLRRRDGKAIDGDDSKFIRANTPPETNQRLVSDEGKAVIMGTNFRFYPGQYDALNKRFEVQDLSAAKYEKNENDLPSANKAAGDPKNQNPKNISNKKP
ncbi:MAG TPA: hypothetical protein VGO50_04410 [Pyrinomonadaceae bacterium]|jgi:hypothetical protein|nr:hypothetical protein [Pyrinomonadaceae bacterium]